MGKFAKTLEELKRIGAESEMSRDSLLWRQGDSGDEVVVLMEGLFDIVRDGPEGEPVVIRTVDSGAILGEMSALDGHARSAAVRASTQCRVLRVPGEEFRALIRSRPDLLEELFWQQVSWVRSLTEEVARTHRPPILDHFQLTKYANLHRLYITTPASTVAPTMGLQSLSPGGTRWIPTS